MYLREVFMSGRRGPCNRVYLGVPGEEMREKHVTVALEVYGGLNLRTGSTCKTARNYCAVTLYRWLVYRAV